MVGFRSGLGRCSWKEACRQDNIGRNCRCRQNYCDERIRVERNWTKQLIEFFLGQIRGGAAAGGGGGACVCTCAKAGKHEEAPWLARTANMACASKSMIQLHTD